MKLIKYFLIVFGTAVIISALCSYWVNKGLRSSKIDGFNRKLNYAASSKNNIDLLLVGSSRVFQQLNPKIIDSVTNLNSYNFGLNGATIKTCFNITQFVLQHQPKAKMVVLNIDYFMFDPAADLVKDARFYPYEQANCNFIYDSAESSNFFHKFKIFDASIYDDNIKYIGLDGLLRPNHETNIDYKGFSPKVTAVFEEPSGKRNGKGHIVSSEKGYQILENFILLCKSRKVKLAFILAPFQINYPPTAYFENYTPIMNRVFKMAANYSVPILDFSNAELNNKMQFFNNSSHLNSAGADIYSTMAAEKIKALLLNVFQ